MHFDSGFDSSPVRTTLWIIPRTRSRAIPLASHSDHLITVADVWSTVGTPSCAGIAISITGNRQAGGFYKRVPASAAAAERVTSGAARLTPRPLLASDVELSGARMSAVQPISRSTDALAAAAMMFVTVILDCIEPNCALIVHYTPRRLGRREPSPRAGAGSCKPRCRV
jgi:hypothetical protein